MPGLSARGRYAARAGKGTTEENNGSKPLSELWHWHHLCIQVLGWAGKWGSIVSNLNVQDSLQTSRFRISEDGPRDMRLLQALEVANISFPLPQEEAENKGRKVQGESDT